MGQKLLIFVLVFSLQSYSQSQSGQMTNHPLFGLSTEVLEHLKTKHNGNHEKILEEVTAAQRDPQAFMNSLPDDLKKKLKEASQK